MKLLLCKNIQELGIVGDIVEVSSGYARNYLLPQHLATEPTKANMRKLAEARKAAEEEIKLKRKQLEAASQRLEGVEVTVRARANEEGVLYGSVGTREITAALLDEGHFVKPEQVMLDEPIRQLDNVSVEVRLHPELLSSIKVWVVREKEEGEGDEEEETAGASEAGMEAGTYDDDRND